LESADHYFIGCIQVLERNTDDVSTHSALLNDCRNNKSTPAPGTSPPAAKRSG